MKNMKDMKIRLVNVNEVKHGDYLYRMPLDNPLHGDLEQVGWIMNVARDAKAGKTVLVLSDFVPDKGAIAWVMDDYSQVFCKRKEDMPRCRPESLENRVD